MQIFLSMNSKIAQEKYYLKIINKNVAYFVVMW